MNNKVCPFCWDDDFTVINGDLVVCNQCSLSFLDTTMTPFDYRNYYQNQYDSGYRRAIPKSIIESFKSRVGCYFDCDRVMDYGAGAGEFVQMFSGLKYATELSSKMIFVLNSKDIITDIPSGTTFNFIILRHVAEHFMSPVVELCDLRDMMATNGRMYIAVPNNMATPSSRQPGWYRVSHTYYYNRLSFHNLLSLSGLEPVKYGENNIELWAIVKKTKPSDRVCLSTECAKQQVINFNNTFKYQKSSLYRWRTKLSSIIHPD